MVVLYLAVEQDVPPLLETFDGKDVMVPNEKFIVGTFTNWTHKNTKQRYRVDFSVAYHSDIRALVAILTIRPYGLFGKVKIERVA